ncbi:hypothetical protein [Hymenobacter volaticus]|uniref:Uncharacterized protein n=1 Tax=Hymenobacter volaticus TaxID=2932254 RepID=A0ABY4G316_9BACT|nr:hypothetical protein [Hymenobacter volaticus]UOQ65237.1 hypothetical protein MUN86_16990 [Hymenobacter volaticus]
MRRQHVFLVLDLLFGEKVIALSVDHPVWIVDSLLNTPVVHQLWHQSKRDKQSHLSLTLFSQMEGTAIEQRLCDLLLTIDEHHGEASFCREEAYTRLTVLGLELTHALAEELLCSDFRVYEVLLTGFSVETTASSS